MPIAKSLAKVQKRKADTKLHPRGRKLKQITRAELRQNKMDLHKSQRSDIQAHKLERFMFAQELCRTTSQPEYSLDEMRTMIEGFIGRNKPELDELAKARRPGRPPTNRQLQVQLQYDKEDKEFDDGFTFVDVTDPKTVSNLLKWDGSWGGLNTLTTRRVKRAHS